MSSQPGQWNMLFMLGKIAIFLTKAWLMIEYKCTISNTNWHPLWISTNNNMYEEQMDK